MARLNVLLRAILALSFFLIFGCETDQVCKPTLKSNNLNWCDVAPIFNNVCGQCHHTGGVGPFSLLHYEEVFSKRSTIQYVLEHKIMPPWKADPSYTHFLNEYNITPSERQQLINWICMGAKNCNNPPKPKVYEAFNYESQVGVPDTVFQIEAYEIPNNDDHYQIFIVKLPWNEPKHATCLEVLPGNPQAVHHISVFQLTNTKWIEELETKGTKHYGIGDEKDGMNILLTNWAKGSFAFKTPDSIGIPLPTNAYLAIQVHYSAGFKGQLDSTRLNIFFNKTTPTRIHQFAYYNNQNLNFPANTVKYDEVIQYLDSAISMTSIWPHTHKIARNALCYAVTPQKDTIKLIKIDDWDYDWQNLYVFEKPIVIPAGSSIIMKCLYDNTSNNPRNPNNPPKDVRTGLTAKDEMLTISYYYMPYKKGDEHITFSKTNGTKTPL